MAITRYEYGETKRLSVAFTNSAGTATDPTAVTLKYITPAGTETTLVYGVDAALLKASTGNYYVDLALSEEGMWFWRWIGTGTAADATDGQFLVGDSRFA